ncbi:MAG TPA: hypothetical protein VGN38_08020 [Caulobacteraceae bacterium]|nr:hypothetical protein [Caulobacteraceae bacterium]
MTERALTAGEWARLSAGLRAALVGAGASPIIKAAAHPAARVSALWRGSLPILARGDRIWWPRAPADVSASAGMAVLQHELQHVLDYRTGWLTAARYLASPRHWRYGYELGPETAWETLGAEQRAMVAEHIWLMENGLAPADELERLRALAPWGRAVHCPPQNPMLSAARL